MALHRGDHDSSECPSSPFANIWSEDEDEESLLESYQVVGTSKFDFTGMRAFRRCCENRLRDLDAGSPNCNAYILFTGVKVQDMAKIEKARRSLPRMCCLHDAREEALVVKLRFGVGYWDAMYRFTFIFADKLRDLGLRDQIICTGCATFGDERRQKEADASFMPRCC